MNERQVLYEVDHCIYCHDRDTDSCSKGMRNRKDGSFKTNALGVPITGCPLGEKISEMHVLKRGGDDIGALGPHHDRQPDVPGHRSSDLQRLHEGLYLPEDRARQHPPDRDQRAHRCLEPPLGVRDLRAIDALQPAQCRASRGAPLQRQERLGLRARAGGLYAVALPLERGLRGGRDRRAQDRAPARGADRQSRACPAPDPRLRRDLRGPRPARHDGFRRGRRVRHHGALGQELPQGDLSHPGAAPGIPLLRRRALRGHPHHQRGLGPRLRSHRDRERRRQADHHPARK